MNRDEFPDWVTAVAEALMNSLKVKDPYTWGHCVRVSEYSAWLAAAAGLTERDQQIVRYAALFHDLGKIGIADSILNKPGRLTPEEDAIMRAHPVKSAEIIQPLTKIDFFRFTLPGILHHHERIDGKGYPDGIAGENIPLTARLILVADTYDAMTSSRPYRKGLTPEVAYSELRKYAGTQFDGNLVEAFIEAHPSWEDQEQELRARTDTEAIPGRPVRAPAVAAKKRAA